MSNDFVAIIDQLNEYRDCSRHIWNHALMTKFKISQDWAVADSFSTIKNELFRCIVLLPSGYGDLEYALGRVSPIIQVKLRKNHQTAVMVNRIERESAGYWDHPIKELDSQTVLQFVNFFDWDPYGFLEMNLVMCEIMSCPAHPEVEAHKLLVQLDYVDVLLHHSSQSE